jgi:hypothetical protein
VDAQDLLGDLTKPNASIKLNTGRPTGSSGAASLHPKTFAVDGEHFSLDRSI